MSSTAVISKLLIDKGEFNTPHGTRSISVLIFQDLAVIPLLVYFAYDPGETGVPLYTTIVTSIGVIAALVFIAPRIMPPIVNFFAQQQSNEIFTVFALMLVIGISLLTHFAGLSLVLGSFLTGMLLANSRHRYLIEDIIRPFREIFLGFFFVSIGLLISPEVFIEEWHLIIIATVVLLLVKPIIIYIITRLIHTHHWTSIQVAVALGGTGEFCFVLLTAAATSTNPDFLQLVLAVNLVCMFSPTMLLGVVTKIRNRMGKSEWLLQARDLTRIAAKTSDLEDHVILCGFGQHARVIIRMFKSHKIPWVAIDSNFELYSAANKAGFNVVFGDARHSEALIALGIFRAKALIITHGIRSATVQIIQAARSLSPNIPVTAKVMGDVDIKEVKDAGASYLSISAIESGTTMASRVMNDFGISPQAVNYTVRQLHETIIKQHDPGFVSDPSQPLVENESVRRPSKVKLLDNSKVVGMSIAQLVKLLEEFRVEFLHLERDSKSVEAKEDEILKANDHLTLSGNQYDLDVAEAVLRGE